MGMFDFKPVKIKKPKIPSARNVLPRKRDIQRMISNKRIREPVSAKIKTAVKKRAGNKCEAKGCRHSTYLDFHHKNMKNDDNRDQNIVLLCPIHHREAHDKKKVLKTKDSFGNTINHKVVSKETKKRIVKKRKKQNPFGMGFGGF